MAPPSHPGLIMSDVSETRSTPKQRPLASSSSRPNAPPSESLVAASDDAAEVLADDQVVGRGRRGTPLGVPQVEDRVGLTAQGLFETFIEGYTQEPNPSGAPPASAPTTDKYYVAQIHNMRVNQLSTFYVDFDHMTKWNEGSLGNAIIASYYRFHSYLINGLHNMIAKYEPQYFREHRQPNASSRQTTSGASIVGSAPSESQGSKTPNQQTDKVFAIAFYNLPLVSRVRSLRSKNIGQLLSISGTVTRTSEVRPELSVATFTCDGCRAIVPNVEQTFRYTEPTQCPNRQCNNRLSWQLDIRQSTFVDWQKVRIQENSSEIPTGSMPRTMDVILRGEIVDRAKAGEKCIFSGALIVVPDVSQLALPGRRVTAVRDDRSAPRGNDAGGSGVSGLKALGARDLTYRLAFLACMVTPDTTTPGASATRAVQEMMQNVSRHNADTAESAEEAQSSVLSSMTPSEIEELRQMVHSEYIYSRLVKSLAPMVYGHEVVKKGVLLQLMSGVSKNTAEGMALRGDINICIVGDPSTSKSQFLKYVCSFAPRAVYTSGKASSAAGLTAAVIKDEETGEFTIEAGALMLADNGVCCIDEFDKMDLVDQVAIHEAMEQQTISISKAGIQATLNARTSILAAANPVGGRYNRKTSLRANINMSAPIMSRFDLFFVILDECNEQVDRNLAQHIVAIHQMRDMAIEPEFSTECLQRYIRFARTFRPVFSDQAKERLVIKYKELRADDAQGGVGRNSYRITVRQLESLIRLSEAIAKANCVEEITPDFVDEAFSLLRQSIISVEYDDVEIEDEEESVEEAADMIAAADAASAANRPADADQEMPDADDQEAAGAQDGAASERQRKKTTITHDKYVSMMNLFVQRVSDDESSDDAQGVDADELIHWYLEQKEAELEGEEDYKQELSLAKLVLKRMVKDNILMAVRGDGLAPEDQAGNASASQSQKVTYVLHPNCAVEEI